MKRSAKRLGTWVCALAMASGAVLQQADRPPGRWRPSGETSPRNSAQQLKITATPDAAQSTAVLRSLPMSFEPAAQLAGETAALDGADGAQFVGRAPGMAVALTGDGITLQANRSGGSNAGARLKLSFSHAADVERAAVERGAPLVWSGEQPMRGKTNYLLGSDAQNWRTNVPHFAIALAAIPVRAPNRVSAGTQAARAVSIEAYGNDGGFEYDLRVPPDADASALRLRLAGARDVRLAANGDLRMRVGEAEVMMLKPVIYSEPQNSAPSDSVHKPRTGTRGPRTPRKSTGSPAARARRQQRSRARKKMRGGNARPTRPKHPPTGAPRKQHRPTRPVTPAPSRFKQRQRPHQTIDGGYVLYADGTIGFRVGAHDPHATLVIDPSISIAYTTFLGGAGSDTANSMAIDASGNVYVAGTTTSASTFAEPTTAAEGPGGGAADFFIAKIDPTKSGADSLVYLTFLGGSGAEAGGSIAVDSKGDVALTGTTTSSDYPVTDKSALTADGTNDAVASELGPAGNTLNFSTVFGGNGAEDAQSTGGIALDSSGDVFVAGDTSSTNLPVSSGALQPTYGGGTSDGFLAKFTPSASGSTVTVAYCTYLGIDATAGVSGVALDASTPSNVYLSGFTSDPVNSFPATSNALQATYGGGSQDAFMMKISPLGKGAADLVYATLLGGSGMDEAFAIAVDTSTPPKVYITGTTASTDFPMGGTVAGYQTALATGAQANAFLTVLSPNATAGAPPVYSTYLGGSGTNSTDSGVAIFVKAPNEVYVAGSTTSTTVNFPWHDNLEPFNGAEDAFLVKMDPTSSAMTSLVYSTPLGGISPPGVPVTASASGVAVWTDAQNVVHVYVAGQVTAAGFPSGGSPGTGFQVVCSSCQESPPAPDTFLAGIEEGTSSLPSVYFSPAILNFGVPALGQSTNPIGVAVYNGGEMPLQISDLEVAGPNAADFSLSGESGCANATVQPGKYCSFGVVFTPSVVGPEAATVVFTDEAPGSPQSLELIGAGAGPFASLSPANINFGNQPQGSTSAPPQTVTLANSGNQPLVLSVVKVTGADVTEFPVSSSLGCVGGQSVPAGGYCTVSAVFAPTSQGAASAQIDFFDNSGGVSGSEQIVNLSGVGTQPGPVASVLPASLTFGTQTVGTTSASQIVTLKNAGSVGLNVTNITITAANPSSFEIAPQGASSCATGSSTLAIGASCTVAVVYAPSAAGDQTANLSFTDDAPGSPQAVALSGNSIQPAIQVSPANLTFASQSVGTGSTAQTITVTNSGSSALTMNAVSVMGADAGDFKESDNCAGKSLGAGTNCQVNVTFSPVATGSRTATVNISDNAAGSPQSVAVSGTATQAGIHVSPASVSFGNQAVQTSSSAVTITAANNGTGALQFSAVSITGTSAADFAVSSDACLGTNVTVTVNANCTMNVTFTPACINSSGAVSATLVLADNAPGSPQSINLSGTPIGNYCVTGMAPETVLAGATAIYSLSAGAVNGYVGNVALTISGCPPNATCTAPTNVSVAGNAQTPFTVNVVTSAGNGAAVPRVWLLPLGVLALSALSLATKKRALRRALAMACFAGTLAVALAACGASNGGVGIGGDPGTPPGPYSITLAGAANGEQQSTTLNLTVNP